MVYSAITFIKVDFGMTLSESLSNQSPVIIYDFNDGPRELIVNSESEFIAEDGNIRELVTAIIKDLNEKNAQETFQKNNTESRRAQTSGDKEQVVSVIEKY